MTENQTQTRFFRLSFIDSGCALCTHEIAASVTRKEKKKKNTRQPRYYQNKKNLLIVQMVNTPGRCNLLTQQTLETCSKKKKKRKKKHFPLLLREITLEANNNDTHARTSKKEIGFRISRVLTVARVFFFLFGQPRSRLRETRESS